VQLLLLLLLAWVLHQVLTTALLPLCPQPLLLGHLLLLHMLLQFLRLLLLHLSQQTLLPLY
jgi:hypothetical protein